MNQYDFLIKSAILVLLPMVPAIAIFKIFPTSSATGEGPLGGIQWKLGGAFAGYIAVALYLLVAMKVNTEPADAEIWTIRGKVEAKGLTGLSPNILSIKTQPQEIDIAPDGSFEIKVVGRHAGDALRFPRLIFDMSAVCFGAKTVALEGSADTFGLVGSTEKPSMKRDNAGRKIEFMTPVILEQVKMAGTGPCSG